MFLRLAVGFSSLVGFAVVSSLAFAGENFYSGKSIRIYVQEEASGYSLYGGLISKHLGRFLEGRPTVSISCMPGGEGLTLSNYLYDKAPHDGTVFAVPDLGLAAKQVRNLEGVHYNAAQFTYIGRLTAYISVHMAWHTTGISDLEQLKHKTLVSGAVGFEGAQIELPKAQNQFLGLNWKVIPGYRGNLGIRMAMERGEIEAAIAPASSFNTKLKQWLNEERVKVLVQYAEQRHPLFPNVPHIVEVVENPEHRALFQFLVSLSSFGRSLVAPPDLPQERTEQLRNAFQLMLQDKNFRADAEKVGADLLPMRGEELTTYMVGVVQTAPEIIAAANKLND